MVEKIRQKISDSAPARWLVLIVVSITMMCGYFLTDVMAPLKYLLEQTFGWDSTDFGIFNSGYGWLNVILLMLIFGGMILDRMGPRFTGVVATGVMLAGALIKYYAIEFIPATGFTDITLFGWHIITLKTQVLAASIGYAIFAVGYEVIGITATKIIVRWFKGRELALALGMNVAFARVGTILALAAPLPIANRFGSISMPILFCIVLLVIGFLSFMVFVVMDRRLDSQVAQGGTPPDEKFRFSDIFSIFRIRGFWYISMLCMLFYAAVFPFLKFAPEFVMHKFSVATDYSGLIPALLPLGTLFLTPLFGSIYDIKGKGASMMILGSLMLAVTYAFFAMPMLDHWVFAAVLVIILGVAFSLVPSAMWPSVPKIIPENKLGTAYALIFWFQNIGLAGVPLLVGRVLDKYGITGKTPEGGTIYDYTIPMLIFLCFGILAVGFGVLLKHEDSRKGFGLEKPNIVKAGDSA